MTEPLRSLDARYYTDPAIFAIEKQHLLASTWQFAGHVSQLEKPGDFFTFSVAGENLFCIKGKDGEIRAFTTCASIAPTNWSRIAAMHRFWCAPITLGLTT